MFATHDLMSCEYKLCDKEIDDIYFTYSCRVCLPALIPLCRVSVACDHANPHILVYKIFFVCFPYPENNSYFDFDYELEPCHYDSRETVVISLWVSAFTYKLEILHAVTTLRHVIISNPYAVYAKLFYYENSA